MRPVRTQNLPQAMTKLVRMWTFDDKSALYFPLGFHRDLVHLRAIYSDLKSDCGVLACGKDAL